MKTKLLILWVAINTINLMAATTFNYSTSVADQTIDGITIQLGRGGGKNDPAVATNSTVRLYANNTITIQGQNIKKISLTFAKNPQKDYASMSVDVGTLSSGGTSTSATDAKTDTWTGNANTITFTIGSTGQRVLKTIVVETGTGGGGGENNVITYTATSRLSGYNGSLDVSATTFGPAITSHAFSNGRGTITCSGDITTIGDRAFYYCSGLTSVTIPNSVTTIGSSAFYYCDGLTSITIPNSVTTIEDYAFYGCGWLLKTNYTGTIADWCKIKFDSSDANPMSYSRNFYINNVEVKDLVIPASVDTIGDYAFYNCRGLTSITIPNSVKTIGDHAFYSCSGLTSVTIGNSVTSIGNSAFSGCSGLTSVIIGNSVTTIGNSAFSGCSGLTSLVVEIGNSNYDSRNNCNAIIETASNTLIQGCKTTTIPSTITTIGVSAFYGCSGLTSVTIPNSVIAIGDQAFEFCSGLTSVTIPNSVTTIGNSAFYNCDYLTSVTIGNSVTTIGVSAFYNCRSLRSVIIGNSVTTIGNYAFNNCRCLTSITIPDSVRVIGWHAFEDCDGLKSVTIGKSVREIGDWAFKDCDMLTKTNFTGTISDWCKIVFKTGNANPVYYSHNFYINDVEVKDLVIPNGVDTIGKYAFYGCSGLISVTIPNSVTTIGDGAFAGCSNLAGTLTIPYSVALIGRWAFYGCSGLTSLTIPNSVTTIEDYAFQNCSGLISITCEAITPPMCEHDCFDGVDTSIPLYVPAGSVEAYKAADEWKEFDIRGVAITTGLDGLTFDKAQGTVRKFIRNNQLHIFHNGKMYNALGDRMR